MSSAILAGPWWEERPRGMVHEGIRKATERIQIMTDAPPGMEEYQNDPIGFMVNELGIPRRTLVWSDNPGYEGHVWDGTPDPISTWFEGIAAWKNVGVESATGTGKSYGLALLKLWFLASFQGGRVFDFATKKDQLSEYSYTEVGKLWPRFRILFPSSHLSISGPRIRMDRRVQEGDLAGWGALGQGVDVGAEEEIAAGAVGMHAVHMLICMEETQGIAHPVTEALENTCTSPHNLRTAVGNPDSEDDALHQFCVQPDVVHVRISALDHPNVVVNNLRDPEWLDLENDELVVPGAVSRTSIARRARKYGTENRIYQSRVRGISPPERADALIKQSWIDRAVELWHSRRLRRGLRALAADVARSDDGDKGAIADGVGAHLDEVETFPCPNPVKLGVRLAAIIATEGILEQHVGVDTGGGYGGGTVDKLKEFEIYVKGLNGGSKADPELYKDLLRETGKGVRQEHVFRNLRAQMWWHLAMDLQAGRVALPPDEELHADLKAPTWKTKLGKIVLEEKDEIKKRLGRSPDKGDAVVMWNWVRFRLDTDEDDEDRSAWDPELLKHEAREGRRVRSAPSSRDPSLDPTVTEYVP